VANRPTYSNYRLLSNVLSLDLRQVVNKEFQTEFQTEYRYLFSCCPFQLPHPNSIVALSSRSCRISKYSTSAWTLRIQANSVSSLMGHTSSISPLILASTLSKICVSSPCSYLCYHLYRLETGTRATYRAIQQTDNLALTSSPRPSCLASPPSGTHVILTICNCALCANSAPMYMKPPAPNSACQL
jgi:hypothetical protein